MQNTQPQSMSRHRRRPRKKKKGQTGAKTGDDAAVDGSGLRLPVNITRQNLDDSIVKVRELWAR